MLSVIFILKRCLIRSSDRLFVMVARSEYYDLPCYGMRTVFFKHTKVRKGSHAECFVMLALMQVLMPLLRSARFCYYRSLIGHGISLYGLVSSVNIAKI